ncbi:MAG TPA: nucleoside hydrolase [Friedmanniella sp.]
MWTSATPARTCSGPTCSPVRTCTPRPPSSVAAGLDDDAGRARPRPGDGAPGSDIDDGFALALALGDPAIDLRLVTTVSGDTDVATATTLTYELLDRIGAPQVPVHAGAGRALLHPASRCGSLPQGVVPRTAPPPHAAVALTQLVRDHPGEVTVVAIGPLTNVALAMLLDPGLAGALGRLVIMGGVFAGTTGSSQMPGEFNVWSDPEAARVVLQSGVVASWVGLDVTRQVRMSRDAAARWRSTTIRSPPSPGGTRWPGSTTSPPSRSPAPRPARSTTRSRSPR